QKPVRDSEKQIEPDIVVVEGNIGFDVHGCCLCRGARCPRTRDGAREAGKQGCGRMAGSRFDDLRITSSRIISSNESELILVGPENRDPCNLQRISWLNNQVANQRCLKLLLQQYGSMADRRNRKIVK